MDQERTWLSQEQLASAEAPNELMRGALHARLRNRSRRFQVRLEWCPRSRVGRKPRGCGSTRSFGDADWTRPQGGRASIGNWRFGNRHWSPGCQDFGRASPRRASRHVTATRKHAPDRNSGGRGLGVDCDGTFTIRMRRAAASQLRRSAPNRRHINLVPLEAALALRRSRGPGSRPAAPAYRGVAAGRRRSRSARLPRPRRSSSPRRDRRPGLRHAGHG